jgi:hypothetical protein
MKGFDPGDMMESEGREERGVMTKKIPAHGESKIRGGFAPNLARN